MGNHVSFSSSSNRSSSQNGTVKVIHLDGTVHKFHNPLTAAELMLDHPQQVVVEFLNPAAGMPRRPTPLPADKKLETKRVYLMLPMRRGKPAALTSEESRRVLSTANKVLRSRKLVYYYGVVPMMGRMCKSTVETADQRRTVVIKKGQAAEAAAEKSSTPEISEAGLPEYLSRQVSGKGWKPCLDTINEKKFERTLSDRLFGG